MAQPPRPSPPTAPSKPDRAAEPRELGTFAVARTRDGGQVLNTLRVGHRFCFSA